MFVDFFDRQQTRRINEILHFGGNDSCLTLDDLKTSNHPKAKKQDQPGSLPEKHHELEYYFKNLF